MHSLYKSDLHVDAMKPLYVLDQSRFTVNVRLSSTVSFTATDDELFRLVGWAGSNVITCDEIM